MHQNEYKKLIKWLQKKQQTNFIEKLITRNNLSLQIY